MSLDKIISVSGKPGLYRLVAQMKNGIIVESIADGKRFPVQGSSKVSALGEISIYTAEKELPLDEIFKKIYEKQEGKIALDHKADNDKIKTFFESIVPDYDAARVYVSDMVKVVKWYNQLIENNAYDPNAVEEAAEETTDAEASSDEKDEVKKAASKKAAAPMKQVTANKPVKAAAKSKPASIKAAGTPRKTGGSQRGS